VVAVATARGIGNSREISGKSRGQSESAPKDEKTLLGAKKIAL
jgi:hypothetical protein